MAFVYFSYPWGLQPRSKWLDNLISSLGRIEFYDPSISLEKQIGRISDLGGVKLPENLMQGFGLPQELLLPPHEDILKWEGSILHEQVWRDLYFLVRASAVIIDGNLVNLNDMILELSLAHFLGIPKILIADRVNLPPQIQYIADVILRSDSPSIVPILQTLIRSRKKVEPQKSPEPLAETSEP